jgi:hypothetical protein
VFGVELQDLVRQQQRLLALGVASDLVVAAPWLMPLWRPCTSIGPVRRESGFGGPNVALPGGCGEYPKQRVRSRWPPTS